MKKLIIILFLSIGFLFSQELEAEKLIDNMYETIINKDGTSIMFDYSFENESYKMEKPISGSIALFSKNRFYLEFNSENKMIQIYNGESLSTILIQEKEIQIDNLNYDSDLFIQEIFLNYKNKFDSKIKDKKDNITFITMTPKQMDDSDVFNSCIDELKLPTCLKLPTQCRIGLDSLSKKKLNECLIKYRRPNLQNILYIEIEIDSKRHLLKSITQKNKYNNLTKINVKGIEEKDENCLIIDTELYQDFEKIDLR